MSLTSSSTPTMIAIEAVVTRADGTVEHLGTVAYWHTSWWRRALWRVRRALRKG